MIENPSVANESFIDDDRLRVVERGGIHVGHDLSRQMKRLIGCRSISIDHQNDMSLRPSLNNISPTYQVIVSVSVYDLHRDH